MDKKKLTGAVIGCGYISTFHFPGLQEAGASVKWVCDINPESRGKWAAQLQAKETADYRDIINDKEVDFINICTFSSSHKEICIAAIEAGKAVICEKTLNLDPADSWEIVSLAEKRGVPFFTIYMKRFIPAVEKAKELLPSIGTVMSAYIRAFQPWGRDFWTDPGTNEAKLKVPASAGGGILVCGGSHILDLVCNFFGRPTRIYGQLYKPEWMENFDVRASALIETQSCPVHYETIAHPLKRIGFHNDGWDETIEITGTKGRLKISSATWNKVDSLPSLLVHHDDQAGTSTEYLYDAVSPHKRAIVSFCKHIAKWEQGPQSKVTGYDVDELIAHFYRSSDTKEALSISWRS